nr:MAG TPA: hypothetical protein [Caudoviricetes sp.]
MYYRPLLDRLPKKTIFYKEKVTDLTVFSYFSFQHLYYIDKNI